MHEIGARTAPRAVRLAPDMVHFLSEELARYRRRSIGSF
jgi:hypothetical protein